VSWQPIDVQPRLRAGTAANGIATIYQFNISIGRSTDAKPAVPCVQWRRAQRPTIGPDRTDPTVTATKRVLAQYFCILVAMAYVLGIRDIRNNSYAVCPLCTAGLGDALI
jgi:hypothetical protein